MPKYTIPKENFDDGEVVSAEKPQPDHWPTISFPASEDQIAALEVGTEIEVIFKGRIESATISKSKRSYERTEIRMEIFESDVYETDSTGDRSGVEELGRDDPKEALK